ncbi:hypothetical protein AGMMS49521_0380 [Campylobacterota bacterium]|nr:hypothetical protein AGMMS49521_0380 [Campylobacterota bacterium]
MDLFESVGLVAVIMLGYFLYREHKRNEERDQNRVDDLKERKAKRDIIAKHEAYKLQIGVRFTKDNYVVSYREQQTLDQYEGIDIIATNEIEICLIACKNSTKHIVKDDYMKEFFNSCVRYANKYYKNDQREIKFIYVLAGKIHESAIHYIDRMRHDKWLLEYRVIPDKSNEINAL